MFIHVKRLISLIVSIVLLLSMLVSCSLFDEMDELSEDDAQEVYYRLIDTLEEEQVFENGCVFLVGRSILVVDQGEMIYYHCTQERLDQMNELFEAVKKLLASLKDLEDPLITGWDYGGTIRLCIVENIDGIPVEDFSANSVGAYFPGGKDSSVHINFYNSDGAVSNPNVSLYLKLTPKQIDIFLEEMIEYS